MNCRKNLSLSCNHVHTEPPSLRHQQSCQRLHYSILYIISGTVDFIDIGETCLSASPVEFHTSSLSQDCYFYIEEPLTIYWIFLYFLGTRGRKSTRRT